MTHTPTRQALDLCVPPLLQGRPDKPDIRVCRLPDIKRKMNNKRASVKDGGEGRGAARVPQRCLWCLGAGMGRARPAALCASACTATPRSIPPSRHNPPARPASPCPTQPATTSAWATR